MRGVELAPVPEQETRPAFDPLRADAHSAEDLDQHPYGIICLDAGGRILRYNLAEARFARLDRASVLGKRFFGQAAPCTATCSRASSTPSSRTSPTSCWRWARSPAPRRDTRAARSWWWDSRGAPPWRMLKGLSRKEEEESAGDFFPLIPWDEPLPDPEMPAGAFLDAVGSQR